MAEQVATDLVWLRKGVQRLLVFHRCVHSRRKQERYSVHRCTSSMSTNQTDLKESRISLFHTEPVVCMDRHQLVSAAIRISTSRYPLVWAYFIIRWCHDNRGEKEETPISYRHHHRLQEFALLTLARITIRIYGDADLSKPVGAIISFIMQVTDGQTNDRYFKATFNPQRTSRNCAMKWMGFRFFVRFPYRCFRNRHHLMKRNIR